MPTSVPLQDVFGVNSSYRSHSYVDRGGLDERLNYALGTDRHVVIHGDSKQGKSWLRARALSSSSNIIVQCRPESSVESIVKEALGQLGVSAVLKRSATNSLEGTLEFSANAEGKIGPLAKLGATLKGAGKRGRSRQVDSEPIGTSPADLSWVARVLKASERVLVIEDFHYLPDQIRRSFSYFLKALGEYQIFVLIVGVWPQDHLLTYYNGDLDGRVDDIHLTWNDAELEEVLRRGSSALGISMSSILRRKLISDSYSNVGLLQRLAEQLCLAERVGMGGESSGSLLLTVGDSLDRARESVASSMGYRYEAFADNFVRGLRRLPEGLEVYKHLLQILTLSEDEEVLQGIDSAEILGQVRRANPSVRQSDLTSALERIDRLQVRIDISPPVLSYNRSSRRIFVVDRSFLFFRRYGAPSWPWDDHSFNPTNDLAATDPLNVL